MSKEDREFKEAQKALRRESRMRRRRSDVRRQGVEESIRLDEEERQADLKASQEGGMMDAAKYREVHPCVALGDGGLCWERLFPDGR